ncbi:MAG: SET domain-containing protein-lysine N-methyltransferase [bacterium]|nr:SET domain-containing protein-lysine N-methyltransferase [bacterium]
MKKVAVLRSKIHGKGFFVVKPTKKGAVVGILRGKLRKNVRVSRNGRDASSHPDWIGIGENTWLDPSPPYKFINHSCNPSAGIKGKVTMIAQRNLKAGDEVTLDYSTIEEDTRWHMKCSCRSRNCRKVIRSIQFLPYTTYKRYLPYIPAYFQKLYSKARSNRKSV